MTFVKHMMDGYNFEQERVFLSWCTETGIRIHPGLQLVFPKKPPTDRDTNSASSPQPPRILAFAARTAPSVAPLVDYQDEDYGSDHDYQDGGSPNEFDAADAEGSKDYSGLRVISNLHIKDGTRVVQIPPGAILSNRNVDGSNPQARRRRSTVVQAFQRDFSGDQTCSPISLNRSQRLLGDQRSPQSALQCTQRPQRTNWADVTASSGAEVNSSTYQIRIGKGENQNVEIDSGDIAQTDANLSLALVLATELRRGRDSRWYGYLQSLPAEAPPLAIFWSDSEDPEVESRWGAVSRRVGGTQLERHLNAPQTKQYIESIRQYFYQIVRQEWLPDCEWSEFRRAYALVSSRAFWVDTYHGLALVPVADAFNHIEENHVHIETDWQVCRICGSLDTCEHDEDMESVEDSDFAAIKGLDSKPRAEHTYDMVANRSIEAGEEVYNTYDSRGISNVELLCRYGFMLEGNSKDVISFEEDDVRTVCESLLSASNLENYVNRIGGRSPFVPASDSTTAASYPRFHSAKGNRQKIDVAIGPSLETRIDGHVIFASVQKLLEDAGIVQRSDRDEWVRTDDSKKDYARGGAKEVNEVTMLDPAVGLDVVSTTLGTGPGQVKTRESVMATTKDEGDETSVGWTGAVMPSAVCVGKGPAPSSSAADARSPLPTRSVKDEQGAREALKEREMTSSLFASSSSSPLNVAGIQPGCDEDDEGSVLPSGRNSPLATARMEIDAEGLVSRALWTRLAREAYCRLMEAMTIIITTALSPSAGGPMDASSAGWLASSSSPSLASPFSAGSTLMPIGEEWEDRNRPTQPLAFSGLEQVEVQAHGQGHRGAYFRRGGDRDREGEAGNQPGVGSEGVVYEYGVEDGFGEVWVEKNRANREREKEKKGFPSFESDRVYSRKANRGFLSIRKRSRVASSFSDVQEEEEEEEESTFEESRRRKRSKLEEEETRMEVKSSLDYDNDEQEWEAREGKGNDTRLEDARIQSSFVIEVVRLVSRLMEELCQRRLGEMWDGEEEEQGVHDDLVLELATRYVTSERAVLQACMSSWLELENQLDGEPI